MTKPIYTGIYKFFTHISWLALYAFLYINTNYIFYVYQKKDGRTHPIFVLNAIIVQPKHRFWQYQQ